MGVVLIEIGSILHRKKWLLRFSIEITLFGRWKNALSRQPEAKLTELDASMTTVTRLYKMWNKVLTELIKKNVKDNSSAFEKEKIVQREEKLRPNI